MSLIQLVIFFVTLINQQWNPTTTIYVERPDGSAYTISNVQVVSGKYVILYEGSQAN